MYTKRVVFLYKVGGWLYVLVMNTAIFRGGGEQWKWKISEGDVREDAVMIQQWLICERRNVMKLG